MAVPFDTLKLARQFEAAGFETKQAGDMAEAIAGAMTTADLANKTDLKTEIKIAVRDLKIWTGSIAAAAVAFLFTVLHIWPPH